MTAPPATEPCYVLVYPNGQEPDDSYGTPHFPTAQQATERAAAEFVHSEWGTPQPKRLDKPCHKVICRVCGYGFDENDVWTFHWDSLAEGLKVAGGCEWEVTGDTARCPGCIENGDDGEVEDDGECTACCGPGPFWVYPGPYGPTDPPPDAQFCRSCAKDRFAVVPEQAEDQARGGDPR